MPVVLRGTGKLCRLILLLLYYWERMAFPRDYSAPIHPLLLLAFSLSAAVCVSFLIKYQTEKKSFRLLSFFFFFGIAKLAVSEICASQAYIFH